MTDPECQNSMSGIRDLVVRLRGYGSVLLPGSGSDAIRDDLNAAADLLDSFCEGCANEDSDLDYSLPKHPLLGRFLKRD